MFTSADFELFQPRFQGDPEWNQRRLDVRRRLQAIGDATKAAYAGLNIALDRRESLHHPHASNGKKVRRQRSMLFRAKKERTALQRFLGKELGKDLDSAVNNVHMQVGLDDKQLYLGLRIDAGAWYDLNVLLKRLEDTEGRDAVMKAAQAADGFDLEIDRGGARPFAGIDSRGWRDLAGVVRPGESSLEIVRRFDSGTVVGWGEDVTDKACALLLSLSGFYELACWTLDGTCPSGASL